MAGDVLVVQLATALQGQVFATEIVDDIASLADPANPFAAYSVGQSVKAKVRAPASCRWPRTRGAERGHASWSERMAWDLR